MKLPSPKAHVGAIAPYGGGKASDGSAGLRILLSANENAYGCSPKAAAAFAAGAPQLHRYPQDACGRLRDTLARKHGIEAGRILCGAGSDEVIRMLVHAYAGPGDEVLYPAHGFLMYRIYAQQFGATPVTAPEKNLTTDVDALLAAVTPATRLVFVANPNNPTGSYIPKSELHRLRAALREDVILVVDGAYAEYAQEADYSCGIELVDTSNTVVTRTFSKIYGLPALRIGWGYGPTHIMEALYKVRSPFNVTQAAIDAAVAALEDDAFVKDSISRNAAQRDRVDVALRALGLTPHPTHGNFIAVRFADAAAAKAACVHLASSGIAVRHIADYGLASDVRITLGTAEENDALIAALTAFLKR